MLGCRSRVRERCHRVRAAEAPAPSLGLRHGGIREALADQEGRAMLELRRCVADRRARTLGVAAQESVLP